MNAATNVTPVEFRRPSAADMHRRLCAALVSLTPPQYRIHPGDSLYLRKLAVQEHVAWLDAIFAAVNEVADFVADEAADNVGARREPVDVLTGSQTDFTAPLAAAAERESP
jgi:hypothetical protein